MEGASRKPRDVSKELWRYPGTPQGRPGLPQGHLVNPSAPPGTRQGPPWESPETMGGDLATPRDALGTSEDADGPPVTFYKKKVKPEKSKINELAVNSNYNANSLFHRFARDPTKHFVQQNAEIMIPIGSHVGSTLSCFSSNFCVVPPVVFFLAFWLLFERKSFEMCWSDLAFSLVFPMESALPAGPDSSGSELRCGMKSTFFHCCCKRGDQMKTAVQKIETNAI